MSETDVTDEQLNIDIANTQAEYNAYCNLADGYDVLSKLPENNGKYHFEAITFRHKADECYTFLSKLRHIKRERVLS
jgi:hypothetical protein